ncbi:VRR-NUC domain-containing protein [Azotobacter chroococcum]
MAKNSPFRSSYRSIPVSYPGEFWHSLLEIYARQDGSLSNGWPDLEITNGKEVMLVEVKVKDRLTPHQRLTIPVLMALGLKCRIVRLIKT